MTDLSSTLNSQDTSGNFFLEVSKSTTYLLKIYFTMPCSKRKLFAILDISGPRRPKQIVPTTTEHEKHSTKKIEDDVYKVCTCGEASSPIEISSDEELERSMLELEEKISLEMSDTE